MTLLRPAAIFKKSGIGYEIRTSNQFVAITDNLFVAYAKKSYLLSMPQGSHRVFDRVSTTIKSIWSPVILKIAQCTTPGSRPKSITVLQTFNIVTPANSWS